MKLYHGSNIEIKQPDLSRSKPFKDFGQGFYLSPVYEQALERAKQITELLVLLVYRPLNGKSYNRLVYV